MLCIDGPSGSGKSTLALALADARAGAVVVHSDRLLDGWNGLPWLSDALVAEVLVPFRAGHTVRHRDFDWATGQFGVPQEVPPANLLIVEGVGAGARDVHALADLLVWVDADAALRRTRALERDPEVRDWWDAWAQSELEHHRLHRTRARADLLIQT